MEETIKKISEKTIKELEKSKKAPFPLYYKEIFNLIAKDEGIYEELNPKLLCENSNPLTEKVINVTQNAVKEISNASNEIKEESQKLVEEIEITDSNEVKNIVIKFSSDLIDKISKMEKKINDLEQELDKAYKELLIDPLTKVYNRKALENDLREILEKGQERDLDLAVAIVDLDNFKTINDEYGHLVGDFVLIKLTEIMRKFIRRSDRIYRYGGDEFIIVFNRLDRDSVKTIINRIVNKISKTTLKYKDQLIKITVSIGIGLHKKGDTIESLIKRADKALYEAKKEKNRFMIEGE